MKTICENVPKEMLIEKLEFVISKLKNDEARLSSSNFSSEPFIPARNIAGVSYRTSILQEKMCFLFDVTVVK